MNTSVQEWVSLAAFVGICFAAAGIGSLATSPSIGGWYASLRKPLWTPPNWVFGPVWSVLYLSMGIAAWLVWRERGFSDAVAPLSLFCLQLALNVAWSVLFFSLRNPQAAFIEIVLLWSAIVATTLSFRVISGVAAGLMLPYLIWVTFAAGLNYAISRMNP